LKNILIVDDSRTIRCNLRIFLETHGGWTVCGEAENGREGVDQALLLNPDLILMDLSMPVMNGFQASRQLKRLLPQIPILMLTTFSSTFLETEALASGIKAVRSKSAGLESRYETMRALLTAA
jgi:DNA-binding NarL/FixJ family response regulator